LTSYILEKHKGIIRRLLSLILSLLRLIVRLPLRGSVFVGNLAHQQSLIFL
jgi:hypothetical protein